MDQKLVQRCKTKVDAYLIYWHIVSVLGQEEGYTVKYRGIFDHISRVESEYGEYII